ncbi:hypothetical protein H5T89_11175 [bacterium]|nr:hypothetical protein [bacterium]
MKFAVGYQLYEEEGEESFLSIVKDYKEHIAEVYFPWGDFPSGRAVLSNRRGYVNWEAQDILVKDLLAFRSFGIKLDLLFNANCYGSYAISRYLENQIISILDYLEEKVGGIDIVTTTSPFIAYIVKKYFPKIETRASVNMQIGTIEGMKYLEEFFDSFHVKREFNRNISYLEELKRWADRSGKNLYILVNSGCLYSCSGQIFHDNIVAHDKEIDEIVNVTEWTPYICRNYLRNPSNWYSVLQGTWIRPEDLHNYEGLFSVVKLATRMHSRPRLVLNAYINRNYYGNLLDLFEPGLSSIFFPYIIDNKKFPEDWFHRTSACDRKCDRCNYCKDVLKEVLFSIKEVETFLT